MTCQINNNPLHNEYVSVYPENLVHSLELGNILTGTVVEFNAKGTFLAVGCNDGRIILYDFQTKSISKQLIHPSVSAPVYSISWFNHGRYLLVTHYHACVVVWDIAESRVVASFDHSFVWKAFINPVDGNLVIISFDLHTAGPPVIWEIDSGNRRSLPIKPFIHKSKNQFDYNFAAFNHTGTYVYVGNSIGMITVVRVSDLKILAAFHVAQSDIFTVSEANTSDIPTTIESLDNVPQKLKSIDYGVIQITFSKNGNHLAIDCKAMIRLYQQISEYNCAFPVTRLIFSRELKDVVESSTYSMCGFSHWTGLGLDSEYVFGITGCSIYIWNRESGEVVRLLEGSREQNYCVVSHPTIPILVSCTNAGFVYTWGKIIPENWSAFAPDFTEIEYNSEYMERENEYDDGVNECEAPDGDNSSYEIQDHEIDIVTISDHQRRIELEYFIPTVPVPDCEMKAYNTQLLVQKQHGPKNSRSKAKSIAKGSKCTTKTSSQKKKRAI